MEKKSFELPAMYADHHVVEVRQILLTLPGIKEVYASSSFGVVQVSFDAAKVDEPTIKSALETAGYLEKLAVPLEVGQAAYGRDDTSTAFRHSTAYEQTQHIVSFSHQTQVVGKGLWPCPGMGPVRMPDDD